MKSINEWLRGIMEPILFTFSASFVIGFLVSYLISRMVGISDIKRFLLTLIMASAVMLSVGWVEFTVSPSKNSDTWYASRALLFNAVNPVAKMIDNEMVPAIVSELGYHIDDRRVYYSQTDKGIRKFHAINGYAEKVFYYICMFFVFLSGVILTFIFKRDKK